LHYIYIQIL